MIGIGVPLKGFMHFIFLCSAKCFSSLVFSEVCCCQKRPCVKEGDGGFPCRGSTPICHRICQSACEHNIAHCHTSLLHCVFALQCDTSACLLQVGQAVGSIDTVWPNHRRPPPVHPLHSDAQCTCALITKNPLCAAHWKTLHF